MSHAYYWHPEDPRQGVVAGAFEHAWRKLPKYHRPRVKAAHKEWHRKCAEVGAASPEEVIVVACRVADAKGIGRPFRQGLVKTGGNVTKVGLVAGPDEESWTDLAARAGNFAVDTAARAGSYLGDSAKEVAFKVLDTGADVVKTGPGGQTAQAITREVTEVPIVVLPKALEEGGESFRTPFEEAGETGRKVAEEGSAAMQKAAEELRLATEATAKAAKQSSWGLGTMIGLGILGGALILAFRK